MKSKEREGGRSKERKGGRLNEREGGNEGGRMRGKEGGRKKGGSRRTGGRGVRSCSPCYTNENESETRSLLAGG